MTAFTIPFFQPTRILALAIPDAQVVLPRICRRSRFDSELEALAAELGAVLTVSLVEGSLTLWKGDVEASICV